jgi:preprotein translocase SecE subunit
MKLLNYFHSAYEELHHVVWPTQNQMIRLTIITVVFVLISALVIGVFDYGFKYAYTFLLNL